MDTEYDTYSPDPPAQQQNGPSPAPRRRRTPPTPALPAWAVELDNALVRRFVAGHLEVRAAQLAENDGQNADADAAAVLTIVATGLREG